eukprot:847336_1
MCCTVVITDYHQIITSSFDYHRALTTTDIQTTDLFDISFFLFVIDISIVLDSVCHFTMEITQIDAHTKSKTSHLKFDNDISSPVTAIDNEGNVINGSIILFIGNHSFMFC